jgi:hypothetical protein
LPLCQRQHETVVGREPNRLKPDQQLAQEMREPLVGRPPGMLGSAQEEFLMIR